MANGFNNGKQDPYPLVEEGKGSQKLLISRSQAVLNALINLLPSNYESSVVGPNYTVYMKAMATELARITIILERLGTDVSFDEVRSEFLWETVGYLVFLNQQLPDLEFDDESFRDFLKAVIEIYFEGSTPAAIRKGVELFTSEEFTIRENFEDARQEGSPLDVSDQFGFSLDFDLQAKFPKDVFRFDKNLRLLIEIIRPAHTLYRLRFMFGEDADLLNNVTDEMRMHLRNYYYDDARGYCAGMAGFDSTSGYIELGSLSVLKDDATDKPLASVSEGATLLIETCLNSGRYTVVGHPTSNSIKVFPKFEGAEDPVSYHVEVDRLGRKKELLVEEDVSSQFYDTSRLTVDGGGPYTVTEMTDTTLTASSNGSDVEYVWDLDGDNVYDDASGASVTYTAPSGPAEITVWVKGTDQRGRKAKDSAVIVVLDQHQVQMLGTGTLTINDVTWSTSASALMNGSGTLAPSPTVEHLASVSMEGDSLMEVILGRNPEDPCAISMYGLAFVEVEAFLDHKGDADLTGTASLGSTPVMEMFSAVDMVGAAITDIGVTQVLRVSAAMTGSATTVTSPTAIASATVTMAGSATTSVESEEISTASVSMVGSASITTGAQASTPITTSMTGTATISVDSTVTQDVSVSMTGTATTTIDSTYTMDPTSIAGLVYWIDPSDKDTIYQDQGGTVAVTTDGDPVERIEDKSGNANHFTNESVVPYWSETGLNSIGSLGWDATTRYLYANSVTQVDTGAPISTFAVAITNVEDENYILNHSYSDGSPESQRLLQLGASSGDWNLTGFDSLGTGHTATISGQVGKAYVVNIEWDTSNNLYARTRLGTGSNLGNADASPTSNTYIELGMARDGTNTKVGYFDGLSGEIICYASSLSTLDETRLRQYLSDKWL